jgi:hypothetical protein
LPALLIALAAGMLMRRSRRPILFAAVFMGVTWILMALTKNAGGAVHHAVLLWPFPQFAIAIVLAGISRRGLLGRAAFALAILFLCATNLLVTNQYHAQFIRYGPSVTWTDAIYPLSNSLRNEPGDVNVLDWDILEQVLLLNQNRIKIHQGFQPGEPDLRRINAMLESGRAVYVTHTPGREFFPVTRELLDKEAAARGYRKEVLRLISDSHGRQVFEVYQFVRQ